MTTLALTGAGPSPLWYLTRGTGLVSLLLLTLSTVLGVLQVSRWSSARWPRFVTQGLHRNVSLLVLVVLAVHIVTAELDPFAPVGWLAVVIPFRSGYRPIWLGLGTMAFDLLIALVLTSLLRERIKYWAWRAVHWASYACWPLAFVHALGTGTDPRLRWVMYLSWACAVAVAAAGAWRLASGWPRHRRLRLLIATVAVASATCTGVWAANGPLRPGWAKKAGTPTRLLAEHARGTGASGEIAVRT